MNTRNRLLRWALAGTATLAVYLAVGRFLQDWGASILWLGTIPFAAAVTLNYLAQRGWVFQDGRPVSASLPRYVAMVGAGAVVNMAAIGMSPFSSLALTQLYAASLVVLSNAALSFLWVFGTREKTSLR